MKVNVMEHRPHTEIIIENNSIGIMIDITDKGVCISIDNNDAQTSFVIDHATATEAAHKLSDVIDNWRW